jgi:hypothetical protein
MRQPKLKKSGLNVYFSLSMTSGAGEKKREIEFIVWNDVEEIVNQRMCLKKD